MVIEKRSDFPPRKMAVAQKHHAISCQEKIYGIFLPRQVALGLPSPSPPPPPPAYVAITTKISRIDRLPDFLAHGAPRAH